MDNYLLNQINKIIEDNDLHKISKQEDIAEILFNENLLYKEPFNEILNKYDIDYVLFHALFENNDYREIIFTGIAIALLNY